MLLMLPSSLGYRESKAGEHVGEEEREKTHFIQEERKDSKEDVFTVYIIDSTEDSHWWAAPVVLLFKNDTTFGLCSDYKVTVNKVSSLEVCPTPTMEDMIATLGEGE